MNLAQILSYMFPIAVNGKDYTLQDDGQGPYIKTWTFAGAAQPTAEQLTAAEAVAALAAVQATQAETLSVACQAAITAGFSSSALGAAHAYPSQPLDQTNLIGAVSSGLANVNFYCADSTGAWARVSHTAAQIKQVLADGATQRMAYSAKLAGFVAQVNAATTVAAVQAIVWQ